MKIKKPKINLDWKYRKWQKLTPKQEQRLINLYLSSKKRRVSNKNHRRLCVHWGVDYNNVRNDGRGINPWETNTMEE